MWSMGGDDAFDGWTICRWNGWMMMDGTADGCLAVLTAACLLQVMFSCSMQPARLLVFGGSRAANTCIFAVREKDSRCWGWGGLVGNELGRTICIEGLLEDFYFQPRKAFLSRNGVDGCGDRQDQTPDTRHVGEGGKREGKGTGSGKGGDGGIIGSAKRRLSGKETRPAF